MPYRAWQIEINKLSPKYYEIRKKKLRHGYTTGACAAAAARGAALMIARRELISEVVILLPGGTEATFQLHGQTFSNNNAACFVIKDAGDDPDITNRAEVHAAVTITQGEQEQGILITGGDGIGRVTKPGLAVPPGEWAINPVPREMITEAVRSAFSPQPSDFSLQVVISIPDGEERARKTLNARLGIVGGLSILGTTGIVRPISAKAWTDTIDAALDVAKACACQTVVLSTGRTSEMAAQRHFKIVGAHCHAPMGVQQYAPTEANLPEEAFIMMGDHIAYTLRACQQRGFNRPIIACQFAKLLKIACGYEDTHAAASELDLSNLRKWAEEQKLPAHIMELLVNANTAREIIIDSDFDPLLLELVCRHAHLAVGRHASGIMPSFMVADYSGSIVFCS